MNRQSIFLVIGGMLSLVIAMGIGRFAYTPILPLMQKAFSFSDAIAGYLATSNYAGYFLGAMVAAVIPLKLKRTTFLRWSLIISIVTTACMGFFESYLLWYMFRFLSGVASAFVFVFASSIILDQLAKQNKASWSGYLYGGVGLGILLTGLVIPNLTIFTGWDGVWIGLAIISAFLAIPVWLWVKETPIVDREKKPEKKMGAPPLKWFPWLVVAYGLEGLGYIVTGTFIVAIAEETSSFGSDAAVVWMVVGLAAIPSCIVWSALAKKWGFVKALLFSMVVQSIGIALPVFFMSKAGLLLSAMLFGATFMGITMLATTLARQMNPMNSKRMVGYLTASYALGQMIGPTIAGILSTFTHSYNTSLVGAAVVVFIGACLLIRGISYEV